MPASALLSWPQRLRSGRLLGAGIFALALCLALGLASSAVAATPAWEMMTNRAPTNVPLTPSTNKVYTLTVKGGNEGRFILSFEDEETGESGEANPLRFDANAEEVEKHIQGMEGVGKGNVAVTQVASGEGTRTFRIEFIGLLAHRYIGEEALLAEEEEPTEAEEHKAEKAKKECEEKKESGCKGPEEATYSLEQVAGGGADRVDYVLLPRNIGGSPTSGTITVTDRLPAGVTTKETPGGAGWTCSKGSEALAKQNKLAKRPEGAGQTEFACMSTAPVNADSTASGVVAETFVDIEADKNAPKLTSEVTVSGGGAPAGATITDVAPVSPTPAGFGIHTFKAAEFGANGATYTQAGGHPYAATTSFFFNTVMKVNPASLHVEPGLPGQLKDAEVRLPEGFIGNPHALAQCTQSEFTSGVIGGPKELHGGCKPEAQVGSVEVYNQEVAGPPEVEGVFNLVPPKGVPAEFGFNFAKVSVRIDAHVLRREGKYVITVLSPDINDGYNINGITLTLWGTPSESSHDAERWVEGKRGTADPEANPKPFLSNPTDCLAQAGERPTSPPITSISVDPWEHPGQLDSEGQPALNDPTWQTTTSTSPAVTGCDALKFQPTIGFHPSSPGGTTLADAPTGYEFSLGIPQNEELGGLATPELKNTTVKLPVGVSVSPSAANGLQACTEQEINLESTALGNCPPASQIGNVKIKTPLLGEELTGRLYVGQPACSPCSAQDAESGKLFHLFIEAEGSGVRIKLPGTGSTNAATGQMTTTFNENPQTPFELLTLTIKGGERASLANPQACGSYSSSALLTPWSLAGTAFGGLNVPGTQSEEQSSAPFAVDYGGAPCSASFSPSFAAGTENTKAGEFSPFDVTFERHDREQDFSAITVQTPPGLLGKIAGIEKCVGKAAETGNCPAGSRIATATSAAGSGSNPFVVSGPVYLTDGYKGAPFGLSIAVPAVAGPFNLGTVVVRSAINVDKTTSAITITSDPLPQSVDGVPFRLKTVRVTVDRKEFMFNPTSCEPLTINASLTGQPVAGEPAATVPRSQVFTASDCAALSFAPKFTAKTSAKTSKALGASLVVRLEQHHGEANIHKVELQLPLALPSRLTTLQKACTEAQFAANPAGCPEFSNVGTAKAITPLLSVPLEGPAYLVSHGNASFPDLVFLLQGEGVHIELDGKTDIKKGITYSRFETVPDAPITSFETTFPEGPHSVLAAFGDLCAQELVAPTKIIAQNGAQMSQKTKIAVEGCGPSISIARAQVKGNKLVVTLKLSKAGTVKITGGGLKTTSRKLGAGTGSITVPLTKSGKAAKRHHRKLGIRATLSAGGQTATKTANVKA